MSIFRKKDVGLSQTEMKRHLTLRDVVLLGIGAMVGTGIFTITGTAASTLAGPALIISVLISSSKITTRDVCELKDVGVLRTAP